MTYIEAENSIDDKESGATMPRPPNLVGRAKSERRRAPGGSRPVKVGINFVNKAFSSDWRLEDVSGTVRITYSQRLHIP